MLKERNRQVPIAGAADALREIAALGPAPEMTEAELLRHLETEQALANVAEEEIERVMAATAQKRAADTIKRAAEYLGPDANISQLNHVANHIRGFGRDAEDFLIRGDYHGFERAIVAFWNGVRDADKLATPRLPLMPHGDNVFVGWSTAEEYGLRNILLKGLCGVTVGDRATSIDSTGATLASGKHISRAQALDAYTPPAGGRTLSVGSLPKVLADIKRREQRQ